MDGGSSFFVQNPALRQTVATWTHQAYRRYLPKSGYSRRDLYANKGGCVQTMSISGRQWAPIPDMGKERHEWWCMCASYLVISSWKMMIRGSRLSGNLCRREQWYWGLLEQLIDELVSVMYRRSDIVLSCERPLSDLCTVCRHTAQNKWPVKEQIDFHAASNETFGLFVLCSFLDKKGKIPRIHIFTHVRYFTRGFGIIMTEFEDVVMYIFHPMIGIKWANT